MAAAEVEYGYGNCAKGGRILPLKVTITGDPDQALNGTLEILTRQSDGTIYAYDFPVTADAGDTAVENYSVPLGVGSDGIALRILDEAGRTELTRQVPLNISSAVPELFIGVLSDDVSSLGYLDGTSVNYGQMRTRMFSLTADTFPSDRLRLDQLDMVLISGYDVKQLDVGQTRALMQWMRDGGVLVFGTGKRVDDTLGVFAPEFLDDMYDEPERTELNLSDTQEVDSPGSSDITLSLCNVSLHGGSVVMSADSIPLVTAANKGNGELAVASFDFADVSSYAASHSTFADLLLTKTLGTTRLERLAAEAYGTSYDEYWSAQSLIDNGTPDLIPNLGNYAVILSIYLLLMGPLLWLFLKKKKAALFYRKAAGTIAVLFTAVILAVSSGSRFRGTFYSYALIRDAGANTVNETAFLNLESPYSASYSVSIPDSWEVVPLTTALNREKPEPVTGTETANVTISEPESEKSVSVRDVGAFSPKYFRLQRNGANSENIGFTGELTLFGDTCTGSVTNRYPYAVTDAAVIFYGKMIPLGTVAAGETVVVDTRTLYHVPLNNNYTVAAFLCGVYDGSAGREERLRALEKANFLSFYLSESVSGYWADARVVGFSGADPENGSIISAPKMENFGMTLVTSTLSLDNRRDREISRSALVRTPEVLSGDYIADTNSCYRGDPVVLGYMPGSDIEITGLVIEEPDLIFGAGDTGKQADSFRGTISFYNYGTGNFDDLEERKRFFTAEELKYYLSPDNMITVRYAADADNEADRLDTALPLLTILGEEN